MRSAGLPLPAVALAACAHKGMTAPTPIDAAPVAEPVAEPEPEPEPAVDLVDVAVPREFRGLWVATVVNLDFPSRTGLDPDAARAELLAIVDGAHARGINALVFQVRPEGDALYASPLEPWSRYLTGTQGGDPGLDPLAELVADAHARGIEVHAWFNPFRAAASRGSPTAETHLTRSCASAVCPWGKVTWLDPGDPRVRDQAVAVIGDVVSRYDIDGVHLDDYFYPYPLVDGPDGGRAFPDSRTYAAYQAGGGALAVDDWRRNNVDTLVERIAAEVTARRADCRFGISPFGIYRPGQPEGIRGMDQVEALHADPLAWYGAGWVDYLAPQLYWSTQREAQRYDRLLTWWSDKAATPSRPLLVGLDITKVGNDPEWTLDEIRTEVELARAAAHPGGQIWFRASPLLRNQAGVGDLVAELYAEPALPTPSPRLGPGDAPVPPVIAVDGAGARVEHPAPDAIRAYVVYAADPDGALHAERILPPSPAAIPLGRGVYAISAVGRGGIESRAVRFTVTDG